MHVSTCVCVCKIFFRKSANGRKRPLNCQFFALCYNNLEMRASAGIEPTCIGSFNGSFRRGQVVSSLPAEIGAVCTILLF
jgi:hypothetical protein